MIDDLQMGQTDPPPGGVDDCPDLAPGVPWPEGVPCVVPAPGKPKTTIPLLTEEQCAQREVQAYEQGRSDEQRSVIKTAVISSAVSVAVGAALGWAIGKVFR